MRPEVRHDCQYGHAWVPVFRRKWPKFWQKYVFQSCWDCDAEKHGDRIILKDQFKYGDI